jgi:hypothetical protein
MRPRPILGLSLVLALGVSCRTVQRSVGLAGNSGSRSTSVYGRWVLATPIDSTSFAGASQVDLTLAPGSFTLVATYPDRAPLTVSGRADLATSGALTLTPSAGGENAGGAIGFSSGVPFTRVASASGSTLVLASPTSQVPVPSSVWYRLEAARVAGLAR